MISTGSVRWEHFAHAADVGVRGFGASTARAFEQAAVALTAVITNPRRIARRDRVEIECAGSDPEILLVDWLNALIYEMASRNMLFSRFRVRIDETGLRGTAWGEPVDRARHHPVVEVKGATLTELQVRERSPKNWVAQCVVDV